MPLVCQGFVDRPITPGCLCREAGNHDAVSSLPPLPNFDNPIANPPTGNGNGVLIRPLYAGRCGAMRLASITAGTVPRV